METGEALCCYKVTRKDELLQDIYLDEDLVLNIEGLNVEDGCYTWYMSVKDKVADWYLEESVVS